MNFNFAEKLDEGAQAAKLTVSNREEIAQVFTDFTLSIARFLKVEIKLYREHEMDEPKRSAPGLLTMLKPTGYRFLYIKSVEGDLKKKLFKYKEDPNGYPVVIHYLHQRYICTCQSELVNALGFVVADPQVHLVFREFKGEYDKLKSQV